MGRPPSIFEKSVLLASCEMQRCGSILHISSACPIVRAVACTNSTDVVFSFVYFGLIALDLFL